jgi:hypothetical protein
MSLLIGGLILIIGFVSAAIVAVAIPLVLGLVAYDLAQSRTASLATPLAAPEHEHTSLRIAAERGVARAFVLFGGAFWSAAAFAGLYSLSDSGTQAALLAAVIPLIAVAVTLIVGWYFERFTAVMLVVASVAVVAWGVVYQFEAGVWMLMTFALLGPMMTAAVLFWLARRDQDAYERVTAIRPELAFAFAARSSIAA